LFFLYSTVHRRELRLELVIEDLVPMKPQKLEQLPGSIEPFEEACSRLVGSVGSFQNAMMRLRSGSHPG